MAASWSARRRVFFLLTGALSAALLAGALLWVPDWSHRAVLAELESVFGRPVRAESVRFRFFPTEMEIRNLRVEGARPEDAPWLEVPRLSIFPSFGFVSAGRIVLSRVRIEKPIVRIEAFADGGDNLPRLRAGTGGAFGIRIRRLSIEGGELVLDHQRIPLELDLPELDGRLNARRAGILAGQISLGPGEARFGTAPPLSLQAKLDLVMEGPRFTLEAGHVQTAGSDLTVTGELMLAGRPAGRFHVSGALDLSELDRHVTRTGFELAGAGHYRGDLQIDGTKLAMQGRLEGERGSWKGTEVRQFRSDVAWDDKGVRIRGLEMDVLGGAAKLDLDLPPPGGRARVTGRLEQLDADRTVARLFGVGTVGAGSAATGDVALEWPRGRFRDVTGTVALELRSIADGRTPVGGRFEWRARQGVQTLERVDFKTPEAEATLRGRIARDGGTDLTLSVRSGDLAETDALLVRVRRALGNDAATTFAVGGSGSFNGAWRGRIGAPIYEGRFRGTDIHYLGVDWGSVDWVGRAHEGEIESRSLVARKGGGELWVDGTLEPGEYGSADAVDVRVRLEQWPAADLMQALAWDTNWTGLVTGRAAIRGRRSEPRGPLSIRSQEGRYWGVAYETLELEGEMRGDRFHAEKGQAALGGGTIVFTGTHTDAGEYDGRLEATGVEIGELLPPVRADVRWGGRVSGRCRLKGTLERPELSAQLSSPRLFLGEEGIGALEAELSAEGDGRVAIRASCESPRVHAGVSGHVQAAAPYVASLVVRGRETSLDPFVRALLDVDIASLPPLIATGELSVDGPLQRPDQLAASMRLPTLQVLLPEYPVHSDGPLTLDLADGRLTIRELRLAGEGTNLLARGTVDVFRDGPLDLTVEGDADLRSLAAVTRRLRARGAARLTMSLKGTRDAPQLDGTLALLGAGLRIRNFPHGLEEVQGQVQFTERAARFRELVGQLGGGKVVLEGETAYSRGGLRSVDLTLTGHDIALRYPEGLRSLADGELRLFGDGERQWVTGVVDVRQAVWTRRYDVASEILGAEALTAPATPLGDALRFDVKVNAPGTLKIDNNLANLDARAELRLQGTSDNPVVLGRADVDRGRVYFQGNTYIIRRGRIEFANPQRLDPFFDIEAETRQGSYRVNLRMNGTLERVYPTLTSDPPLSAVQILNLLAGTDENEVARLGQARTDRARIAEQGAASLAAGRLAEGVGLERQAERLFGLNRFSIDPSVLKGGITNPAARITVGKRLTPDLSVLYSVDLRGTEERLFSAEYTLRDWLSVLMTRSEPGGFGVDARVQRSR